ncbi:hypothetical protein [Actinomadura keratinilytica]|jgi:hypothetical protein|uniref:MerR family transcriptional regulator n=1 Tax=Actinomadura keratinilytica TaxID=547461 RepID=A0ABP7YSR4_9ACTN
MTPREFKPTPGYPRRHLGQVARVNGIDGGSWITARAARLITGLDIKTLAHWETLRVISVTQDGPGSPRLYLRPEMDVLAGLRSGGVPPTLRQVRQYLSQREEQHMRGGSQ